MSNNRRQLRIAFTDESERVIELPSNESAREWLETIRKNGGVWIGPDYFPFHAIIKAHYEQV